MKSKNSHKKEMMVIPINRQKLSAICLFLGSFFLPFGYDAAFAALMKLTGSYWITDIFFYFVSACFFGLYFYLSGNNPFKALRDVILTVYYDRLHHFFFEKKRGKLVIEEIDETDKPV